MRMLVKAIPILHSYLPQLKIIDMHVLQQQVCLYSTGDCVLLCACQYFLSVYGSPWWQHVVILQYFDTVGCATWGTSGV